MATLGIRVKKINELNKEVTKHENKDLSIYNAYDDGIQHW
jgi:hypothetical protein